MKKTLMYLIVTAVLMIGTHAAAQTPPADSAAEAQDAQDEGTTTDALEDSDDESSDDTADEEVEERDLESADDAKEPQEPAPGPIAVEEDEESMEEDDDVIVVIEEDPADDTRRDVVPEEVVDAQADDEAERLLVPEVRVIGSTFEDLEFIPGTARVVSQEDLENLAPVDPGEALKSVAGVHATNQEDLGMRLNVGIRGLSPSVSRQVLILEDGIPVALAPYGEPEMYVAPPIERIERIEVVKGSGSILFGPQTIGGVINFVTPQPPQELKVTADARAGMYGYGMGHVTVGNTHGQVGYYLSLMHQRFESPRRFDIRRTDFLSKFRLRMTDRQQLTLKFDVYDELSASTYIGLTTPQYENDPRANYAIHDLLPIRRYGVSATHAGLLSRNALLETRIYAHRITRNWRRQDYDRSDGDRAYERIIDGTGRDITGIAGRPDDGSAVYFRNSTGNRNREFTVAGMEPRLTLNYEFAGIENELQTGARYHFEQADERRIEGDFFASDTGTIRDDEVRYGNAVALYALNRFMFLDRRLKVSPGLRLENFWSRRDLKRTRIEGTPTDLNPVRSNQDFYFSLIPGIGASYEVVQDWTVFGGAHRGYAPPRTKDAINADGDLLELDPEFSINYELGIRGRLARFLEAEVAGFVLDFSQQIIPPAEADGAVSADPVLGGRARVNAGQTLHYGAETYLRFDPAALMDASFALPIGLTYTWVQSQYQGGWNEDLSGNRLPYSPEHRVYVSGGFQHPVGLSLHLGGDYISEQFTDKNETVEATIDGQRGQIDGRFLLDARAAYTLKSPGLTFYVIGKNLLNTTYIATRAPEGIKPGLPLHVMGGVRGEF